MWSTRGDKERLDNAALQVSVNKMKDEMRLVRFAFRDEDRNIQLLVAELVRS